MTVVDETLYAPVEPVEAEDAVRQIRISKGRGPRP